MISMNLYSSKVEIFAQDFGILDSITIRKIVKKNRSEIIESYNIRDKYGREAFVRAIYYILDDKDFINYVGRM